jgi:hypothetical protein
VTIHDSFGAGFRVSGGQPGGAAVGLSGDRGSVRDIKLDGFNTDFRLIGGGTGVPPTLNPLGGGRGGNVTNVSGVVGRLFLRAGDGLTSSAGPGGAGGSVSNINITGVGEFVRSIMAGAGGNGGTIGGTGGSVFNIRVAGDIGDFSSNFEMDPDGETGQGGISVGQGGTGATPGRNGSVLNLRADRIATILAGRPAANAITAANAVTAISNVRAFVVGADVNGNELFDYVDLPPPGFNLGDGDTAIDGLVVVRAGGLGAILNPLTGESIAPLDVETVA